MELTLFLKVHGNKYKSALTRECVIVKRHLDKVKVTFGSIGFIQRKTQT